jgi:hypothetical protein
VGVFLASIIVISGLILARYIWGAIVRDIKLIWGYGRLLEKSKLVLFLVTAIRCTAPVLMLVLVLFSMPVLAYTAFKVL